jgi:hypothetical protein
MNRGDLTAEREPIQLRHNLDPKPSRARLNGCPIKKAAPELKPSARSETPQVSANSLSYLPNLRLPFPTR